MSSKTPPPSPPGGVDFGRDTTDSRDGSSSASSSTRYAEIQPSHLKNDDDVAPHRNELTPEQNAEVLKLARRISQISEKGIVTHGNDPIEPVLIRTFTDNSSVRTTNLINPYIDQSDPELNPKSYKFNARKWTKTILKLQPQEEGYEQNHKTAGVMFRNLSVHGFGAPTDYQKNVANVWLQGRSWVGLGQKNKIQILRNFEGVVRAGEMCVVLGRPGSGCSTFLKTIAGETHGVFLDDESEISYQGIPNDVMHKRFRGEVIYQAENDIHFPQLTVGQTLDFAAKARAPRNRIPGVTREQYAQHQRDVVMTLFGLSHTLNTPVGNDFIRGVSGGERKRVSIAEITLSGSPLQCWDNSTRGLDSGTAIEFIKALRMNTDLAGTSCMLSIYQAPQAAYDLFDKVIVLYEGRQIYFGKATEAKKYFTDMGFICRERSTTADFLTSITNPAERIIAEGFENRVPRSPDEFSQHWVDSQARRFVLEDISSFEADYPMGGQHLSKFQQYRAAQKSKSMRPGSPFTISMTMQIWLCMVRGFQRLRNDMTLALSALFGNTVLALVIGSVFYNLPPDASSFFARGSLLFFAVLMNAFASALEILTLYAQRPIIEKHAKYALYHPSAEAISSMLVDMPSKILNSIFFNLMLYFMTNLRREVDKFFIFLLIMFCTTLVMSNIFRSIAAFSRTIHQAMPFAAVFILALIVYTGFTIPTRDMPAYMRWINYLNPIGYAFEALLVNEFSGRDFPCVTYIPSDLGGALPMYTGAKIANVVCSTVGAEAGNPVVSGDNYLRESFDYSYSHLWRNFGLLIAFFSFFLFTYLTGTEYIASAKSKGEILVFRRGKMPKYLAASGDEEGNSGEKDATLGRSATGGRAAAIQRQTAIFHWSDVTYDIKIKDGERRLLDNIDGWVKPGTLTALMGVSGAGKTTLLDVLANRVTMGVVGGNMCVDGHQRDGSFQRKTGYVQQQDLHLATSTVREALEFSALLRQAETTPVAEKLAYAEEVIDLLEMRDYADAVVGVPGEGLNVEQRKRLTIGVELAAKPELLLFLDEPTSGLDSQTAWATCALMRKLANNGQAILCTIHQPSAILFQEFDRLLFLASGGKTVYFGDIGQGSKTLISYFERNGGPACPPDANPAEWMLEVIGAAPGAHTEVDWFATWSNSPEKAQVKKELDEMTEVLVQLPRTSLAGNTEFAVSFWQQTLACTKRVFEQYWRTPSYIYAKTFLSVASAVFIGFSFFMSENNMQGLQNQMFSIFMLTTIFGNISQQIMPQFVTQRSLYEVRERPSKVYSWKAFMAANIIVEIPWQALMALFTFVCWYYPIGLYRNTEPTDSLNERSGLMFLLILAFYIWICTFSHLLIAGIETAETGANIGNLLYSLSLIFCGVLAAPGTFPKFWNFLYRVSPFTYLVSAMLSTGIYGIGITCSDIETLSIQPPSGQTCAEYLTPYLKATGGALYGNANATSNCEYCLVTTTDQFLGRVSIKFDERWRNLGILVAYIIFNIFGAFALYWLARVPRGKKFKKA